VAYRDLREFLAQLDLVLAALRDRFYETAHDAIASVGTLCGEWAKKLGLSAGIPIAIGEMDVHYGAIGSGVSEGTLVKVIGTSTCDCGVVSADKTVADIPGICGIVKGAILPGYYGLEEETKATFRARLADDATEYLRTGDLGFLHGGQIYVT